MPKGMNASTLERGGRPRAVKCGGLGTTDRDFTRRPLCPALALAESPNTAGAGATGGIIGGIIAAIIATAVAATGILICRQQQKEQRLQGAEEEDE